MSDYQVDVSIIGEDKLAELFIGLLEVRCLECREYQHTAIDELMCKAWETKEYEYRAVIADMRCVLGILEMNDAK